MASSSWYNDQWTNRQIIEIDNSNVDEDLTNFVMLITEHGLSMPGDDNDLFDKCRTDGRDIVVCYEDGVTKLPQELVSFNFENRVLELYVKVPKIHSTEKTLLFVYYGNNSHVEPNSVQVWSDYQYVSHNGGVYNSKTETVSSYFGNRISVDGLHGVAGYLENDGDVIDTGLYRVSYPLTISAIIKPDNTTPRTILGNFNSTDQDFHLYQNGVQWVLEVDNAGGKNNNGQVNPGEWNYLTATISNTTAKTYQDGALLHSIPVTGSPLFSDTGNSIKINDIGNFQSSNGGFALDEVRISMLELSSAYIKAEYINTRSIAAFYTVTPEESVSGVYVYAELYNIDTTEAYDIDIAIGSLTLIGAVSHLPFMPYLNEVATGTSVILNDTKSFPITGQHFSVEAQAAGIGLNISFGAKNFLAGGTRFRPTKPFELFKESNHHQNKDSRFLSGIISETVNMGGVVCYIWLMEGTFSQVDNHGERTTQLSEAMGDNNDALMSLFGVQDAILGENRDRSYSKDCFRMKGTYAVSQNELDFARFGVMMNNVVIQLEMHKEDMERICGRRLIPGDIVEMPHLREVGIQKSVVNKYYKIDNVTKSPSGYDHTYNYHILALTLTPVVDAHEFLDLMERTDEYDTPLGEQIGTRSAQEALTAHIQNAAAEQTNTTGWDISPLYIDDEDNVVRHVWSEDGEAPNGRPVAMVTAFPQSPSDGDYVCRVDHYPNRLYRYQSGRWLMKEIDAKRDWQPYNWTRKLRDFATDRSLEDDMRPWEYKSVHDILTPRQGTSNPSPKGHDIKHLDIFNFDKKLKVEIPDIAEADAVIRSATLNPQMNPTVISDHLNGASGQYNYFMVYYVLKQGNNQQTGEIMISDDGLNTSMDHEWTVIGAMPITFTVTHHLGYRKLRYTLSGTQSVEMQYYVEAKWSLDD